MARIFIYMTKRIYWDLRSGLLSFLFLNTSAIIFIVSVIVNYCHNQAHPDRLLASVKASTNLPLFLPLNTTSIKYVFLLMLCHFIYLYLSAPLFAKYRSRIGKAFVMRYVARVILFSPVLDRCTSALFDNQHFGIILEIILIFAILGFATYMVPFWHINKTAFFFWTFGEAAAWLFAWAFYTSDFVTCAVNGRGTVEV